MQLPVQDAYDLWAESYDTSVNPLGIWTRYAYEMN